MALTAAACRCQSPPHAREIEHAVRTGIRRPLDRWALPTVSECRDNGTGFQTLEFSRLGWANDPPYG
jgi:hypothetical protein